MISKRMIHFKFVERMDVVAPEMTMLGIILIN